MTPPKSAVLLLAHGSPETVADVPEFMRLITDGRSLPETVIEEVKRRYARIGRSPLLEITLRQAELLERKIELPVYVGMRNWKPFIREVVQEMEADGIREAVIICLTPQNSRTSVGLYRKALLSAIADRNITIQFVESWHDHPELIRAFAEKLRAAWRLGRETVGQKLAVIFTAHSVPTRTIQEGDPYESQARATARLVAQQIPELGGSEVKFAFQSQGMSGEPWIGPTVEETILGLKLAGYQGAVIQPIGFLCDHIEVLYDIDVVFKKFAEEKAMKLWRAESLNDSSALIAALADLVYSSRKDGKVAISGPVER
jgi:protoporphyrin/coproporphyrin ferrochelatase